MYNTRQQQMAIFGTNKQGMANKQNSTKGATRRVLGDIGNVVAELPARQSKDVKNVIPGHRPITRRYVAALANIQQHTQGNQNMETIEDKQPRTMSSGRNPSKRSSETVEIEDYLMASESLEDSATEAEGSQECCEVEMEDSYDIFDIDEDDAGDPLAVVEYVQDIYDSYKTLENISCVPPNYMSLQKDINDRMRGILIDWLIEVHHKFQLMEETLYLTVNIIDRYLSRQTVVRKHLQLVGVAAMFIACKYEEVSVPVVDDFIVITDNAYNRQELLQMEKSILNVLQFTLSVPTPYQFVKRFLKVAQSDEELEMVTFFLVELCLVEYSTLKFQPSLLAAAAIFTAQCTLRRTPFWNKPMEIHTGYLENHLWECAQLMVHYHQHAAEGKLSTVHKKYSNPKYHCAAKTQPALLCISEVPK